jgi:hypothetical protein
MMEKIILYLLFLMPIISSGQNVKISQDINLRDEYAYDILKVNQNIVFYRDKGGEFFLDIFDLDLNFKRTAEIFIDEKKPNIDCILSVDSTLVVYYSYSKKDTAFIKAVRYDKYFNKQDTATIYKGLSKFRKGELKNVISADKTKIMFFYSKNDFIHTFTSDTRKLNKIESVSIECKDIELSKDFAEAELTNDGRGFFLYDKDNDSWSKQKHLFQLLSVKEEDATLSNILMTEKVSSGVKMKYDNLNKKLIIAGLYSNKSPYETKGYFLARLEDNKLLENAIFEPIFNKFDLKIGKDIENSSIADGQLTIDDFYPKALLLRNDGGIVLVTELQREYSRRFNSALSTFDRSNFGSRNFVDYYSDDLLLFSINPDGSSLWSTTLFKKQFSQDDEGIFSSILIMKNPSAMHIIFNDEIKSSNTVSEYIIDGLGNYKRRSVLNTEYQNLKIKFKDGFQISSNAFIAISEKANKINLIKVEI